MSDLNTNAAANNNRNTAIWANTDNAANGSVVKRNPDADGATKKGPLSAMSAEDHAAPPSPVKNPKKLVGAYALPGIANGEAQEKIGNLRKVTDQDKAATPRANDRPATTATMQNQRESLPSISLSMISSLPEIGEEHEQKMADFAENSKRELKALEKHLVPAKPIEEIDLADIQAHANNRTKKGLFAGCFGWFG